MTQRREQFQGALGLNINPRIFWMKCVRTDLAVKVRHHCEPSHVAALRYPPSQGVITRRNPCKSITCMMAQRVFVQRRRQRQGHVKAGGIHMKLTQEKLVLIS
jgi:hypothetical protein